MKIEAPMKIETLIQRVNDGERLPEDYKVLCRTLVHTITKGSDERIIRFSIEINKLEAESPWEEAIKTLAFMGSAVARGRVSARLRAKHVMEDGVYDQLSTGSLDEEYDDLGDGYTLSMKGMQVLDICNKHLNWAARCYQIEDPDRVIDHVMRHLDAHMSEGVFDEVSVALDCLDPTKMTPEAIGAALTTTGQPSKNYDNARQRFIKRVLDAGFDELLHTLGVTP